MTIQYRYAFDEQNGLVDVLHLQRGAVPDKPLFRCVGCNGRLTARLGEVKAKHFAHASQQSNCAYESYIHQLAKRTFQIEYSRCLERNEPFHLVRKENVTCDHFERQHGYTCARVEERSYDLTQFFDRLSVEKRHNGFVADVLLESSRDGEVAFVEFAVTHRCDEEKVKSGARIIEYSVADENDLTEIKARRFADSDARLSLHNLRLRSRKRSLCSGRCPEKLSVFVIYESQKSILLDLDPGRDVRSQIRGEVRHFAVLGKSTWIKQDRIDAYKQQVRKAHFDRLSIRNCFVCRYHGADGIENAVFCKVIKRSVGSHEAIACEKYRAFRSMAECITQDKKNDAYAERRRIGQMVNFILPKPP